MHYLYLLIAISCEVIATSTLKATAEFSRPWPSLLVLSGYGASFYFLSLSLRQLPVGIAYALWSGIGIILVTLYAWLRHGERLDTPALLGMALIVSGVGVINLLSKASQH